MRAGTVAPKKDTMTGVEAIADAAAGGHHAAEIAAQAAAQTLSFGWRVKQAIAERDRKTTKIEWRP